MSDEEKPDDLKAKIAELENANKTLVDQNAELIKQLSVNKVDRAISNGELAPAKREYALNKVELNSLDEYLAVEKQTFNKTANNSIEQQEQDKKDPDLGSDIFNQLGIEE